MGALAAFVDDAHGRGLRVAHCHGVFDLVHPGVVRTLERARGAADCLVVTVVADDCFERATESPTFNHRLRADAIAAFSSVDRVAVASATTRDVVETLRPDVFAAAADLSRAERGLCLEDSVGALGVEILEDTGALESRPDALNRFFAVLVPQTEDWLAAFRERYDAAAIRECLETLRGLRVVVVGDVIIDEYHYCRAVGKSSKSATLTARHLSSERHAGGVLAVANHAASFVDDVRLVSFTGRRASDETFVRSHLKPNVLPALVRDLDRPTVVKRRYVDPFQLAKMFEVMWLGAEEPSTQTEDRLIAELGDLVDDCDLVIASDFGHGSIGARTIEFLSQRAPFLAVNTQTNSANFGFNPVTKYRRADYVCIDEQELQLAHRTRSAESRGLLDATARAAGARLATVTLGRRGSLTWARDGAVTTTPVLTTDVVDSVGAGDAYLAVTSLGACAGWSPEILGFIGNCVGALAVRIVGNRESVEKDALVRFVESLF